jgi:hypothetical protein
MSEADTKTGKQATKSDNDVVRSRAVGSPKLADSLGYPPRGMRADRAAAYLDMSTSSFLRLVEVSKMPKAVPVGGMTIWDRLELDAAFENLKNPEPTSENTMHKLLGIKP